MQDTAAGLIQPRVNPWCSVFDRINLLLVFNGTSPSEDSIMEHFEYINNADDLKFYNYATVPDRRLVAGLDIGNVDIVILSGFSPGVSQAGLENLVDSGKPVLAIERGGFYYAERLGLVSSAGCHATPTTSVLLANEIHPITYIFDEELTVLKAAEGTSSDDPVICGVPSTELEEGVLPIAYSNHSLGEIAVISDDSRSIVASNIHDLNTSNLDSMTLDGWMLFDMMLSFIHPSHIPWAETEGELFQVLSEMGLLSFISAISYDPGNWEFDSARRAIWPLLFRQDLPFMRREIDSLLVGVLYYGWGYEQHFVDGGEELSDVVLSRFGSEIDCNEWYTSIGSEAGEYRYHLPTEIRFGNRRPAGEWADAGASLSPRLEIVATDGHADDLFKYQLSDGTIGPAAYFSLVLHTNLAFEYEIELPAGYTKSLIQLYMLSGTTGVQTKRRLQKGTDPNTYTKDWWGRYAGTILGLYHPDLHLEPVIQSTVPYDLFPHTVYGLYDGNPTYSIFFDVYKYSTDYPTIDSLLCMARFFYRDAGDSTNGLDRGIKYARSAPVLPLEDPFAQKQCVPEEVEGKPEGYRHLFDPFRRDDVVHPEDPSHYVRSLPNTFKDCILPNSPAAIDLKPRMQLMLPANAYHSTNHPMEKWCNENAALCYDLSTHGDAFKSELGIPSDAGTGEHYSEWSEPSEHIHRNDSPSLLWEDSRGPWMVPHLTAGVDTLVAVLLRRESNVLPDGTEDVICECYQETDPRPVAWLEYNCNEDYSICERAFDGEPDPDSILLEASTGALTDEELKTWRIVQMSCGPIIPSLDPPEAPFEEDDLDWLEQYMDLAEGQGVSFMSERMNCDWDGRSKRVPFTITIPSGISGRAKIAWEGKISYKIAGSYTESPTLRREFPLYIDSIRGATSEDKTWSLDNSSPSCWVGSTVYQYGGEVGDVDGDGTTDDVVAVEQVNFDSYQSINPDFENTDEWLQGSDEGVWVRVESSEGSKLYCITGDVIVSRNAYHDPFPLHSPATGMFNWYHYRGSTTVFYMNKLDIADPPEMVSPGFINGYPYLYENSLGFDFYPKCPVMLPEMIDQGHRSDLLDYIDTLERQVYWSQLPWEILRADGFEWEHGVNATGIAGENYIQECSESGGETTAAVSAFQTRTQRDTGEGKAYIWFGNGTDWSGAPQEGEVNRLFRNWLSPYLWAYEKDYIPWDSFLAEWDTEGENSHEKGLDEFGRSVRWHTNDLDDFTTMFWTAVVAVDDLSRYGLGYPIIGPGILVWHSGRYRDSPIYFSYVPDDEILNPSMYRHFAGFNTVGDPQWSFNESDAVPVIWDSVGELSAVYAGLYDGMFKLLYSITLSGHDAIVMREAENPWGPFSQKTPLFDCLGSQQRLTSCRPETPSGARRASDAAPSGIVAIVA